MKVSVWEVIGVVRTKVSTIDADGLPTRALQSNDALSPPHLLYKPGDDDICFESTCVEHDGTVRVTVLPYMQRDDLLIRELADGVVCIRIGDTEISIEPVGSVAGVRRDVKKRNRCP